jgi:hypothetical protein
MNVALLAFQGGFAMGPVGDCVCPNCGKSLPHQKGVPCSSMQCPGCATKMTRAR